MWATERETREEIVDRYRRVCEHSDATIEALAIDASGHVPWWPRPDVMLFNVLVHMLTDTSRHTGHADILREQLDGATAAPRRDAAFWAAGGRRSSGWPWSGLRQGPGLEANRQVGDVETAVGDGADNTEGLVLVGVDPPAVDVAEGDGGDPAEPPVALGQRPGADDGVQNRAGLEPEVL